MLFSFLAPIVVLLVIGFIKVIKQRINKEKVILNRNLILENAKIQLQVKRELETLNNEKQREKAIEMILEFKKQLDLTSYMMFINNRDLVFETRLPKYHPQEKQLKELQEFIINHDIKLWNLARG